MYSWSFDGTKIFLSTKQELRQSLLGTFGSYGLILEKMHLGELEILRCGHTMEIDDLDKLFNMEFFE